MARQVRLFLIRHGETVDNVAQLTAGSRDSELTNHGFHQAARLGQYFKSHGVTFTHIFSSHLQRAATTAAKIREAQDAPADDADTPKAVPDVVELALIMEQDFGFYEGRKWGQDGDPERHRATPGFVDVESKESMSRRIDAFLDAHLFPILNHPTETGNLVVAVVSHGRILSVLWRCLLSRLPPKSITFSQDAQANLHGYSLDHLGGWANTGYLELHMRKSATQESAASAPSTPPPISASAPAEGVVGQAEETPPILPVSSPDGAVEGSNTLDAATLPLPTATSTPHTLHGWRTTIETVNGRDHLKGLKRTGGGVGSARHDASQKSIESFFKKRRME